MKTRSPLPRLTLATCVAATLSGCMSMSGLSGSSSYACKAPDGVTCDSVSGTYANAIHNNLPGQRPRAAAPASLEVSSPARQPSAAALPSPIASAAVASAPLRSSARILRLWFKPWEDADRDLYDQGYLYVQIDSGQWLIDHAQRQIRDAYAPLRPPPRAAAPSGDGKNSAAPTPNPKSAPRLSSADNPFPGLVPPVARPEAND